MISASPYSLSRLHRDVVLLLSRDCCSKDTEWWGSMITRETELQKTWRSAPHLILPQGQTEMLRSVSSDTVVPNTQCCQCLWTLVRQKIEKACLLISVSLDSPPRLRLDVVLLYRRYYSPRETALWVSVIICKTEQSIEKNWWSASYSINPQRSTEMLCSFSADNVPLQSQCCECLCALARQNIEKACLLVSVSLDSPARLRLDVVLLYRRYYSPKDTALWVSEIIGRIGVGRNLRVSASPYSPATQHRDVVLLQRLCCSTPEPVFWVSMSISETEHRSNLMVCVLLDSPATQHRDVVLLQPRYCCSEDPRLWVTVSIGGIEHRGNLIVSVSLDSLARLGLDVEPLPCRCRCGKHSVLWVPVIMVEI